jgi:predicted acyltransferase (DUF342 family)
MRGFAELGAIYALLWAALLVPGALVIWRRATPLQLPEDETTQAWEREASAALERRASGRVLLGRDVVIEREAPKRRPAAAPDPVRVRGALDVPDGGVISSPLIVDGNVRTGTGCRLAGPIMARGSVALGGRTQVDSWVISGGELHVLDESVVRGRAWAQRAITLGHGASIDGGATSKAAIVLGAGARVPSAEAPVVRGGPPPAAVAPALVARRSRSRRREPAFLDALAPFGAGGRRSRSDLGVPAGESVSSTLVVDGALVVGAAAELEAPARASGDVELAPGAVARAQVVSDASILCDEGSAIAGPAVAGGKIVLAPGAAVYGGVDAAGGIWGADSLR